jgi:hypothetical protein
MLEMPIRVSMLFRLYLVQTGICGTYDATYAFSVLCGSCSTVHHVLCTVLPYAVGLYFPLGPTSGHCVLAPENRA